MLHKYFKKFLKALKFDINAYKSFADASRIYLSVMKVFGSAVLTYQFDSNNRPFTKFTALGACGFVFWNIVYFYHAYTVYLEDQTILRFLYDTILKHYGDDLSRIVSLLFVVYMMWKIPFHLSGHTLPVEHLLDMDKEIEKLGIKANFSEFAYFTLLTGMGQMTVVITRFLSLWLVHKHMPRAILVQLGYSDSVALIYTTHLAFALIFLRERHRKLNKTLNEVKNRTDLIFVASKKSHQQTPMQKDNLVCFKIRTCSIIYGKLYKASGDLNKLYGFATTLTMFFNLLYVILNLFYLMEATASGLFHDVERYTNFVIYVFWQISYATGIAFLIVYFCVSVVEEAKRTSFIAHEIINANWSPQITEEAMKLSMQLLHLKPEFTACRMVKLDYAIILQVYVQNSRALQETMTKFLGKLHMRYKNIIEAGTISRFIRKIGGMVIIDYGIGSDNRVKSYFTYLGFAFFLFWFSLYFFCAYTAYFEGQAILKYFYNTRLRHYGDEFILATCVAFVLYIMWKVPINISGNSRLFQMILDIDQSLQNLGTSIDFSKIANTIFIYVVIQCFVFLLRIVTITVSVVKINVTVPYEFFYVIIYTEFLVVITASFFNNILIYLKRRYEMVNKMIDDIRLKKCWENHVLLRDKRATNMEKALKLQDTLICEKIQACCRLYSDLFEALTFTNKAFGLSLLATLMLCFTYILLNLFYFMEATAAGLFHDVPRYVCFLMYVFWQIALALGVNFSIVYFCESVTWEIKQASFLIHQLINMNMSPTITDEAKKLSLQLLHEKPMITASGMVTLDFTLIHEGARSVGTTLVILLQFVADH